MKHLYFPFLAFVFTTTAFAQATDVAGKVPGIHSQATDPKTIRICAPSRTGIMVNPPLWVVNGVVVKEDVISNYIRPANIESMNVLKDASATSLYGGRGQNGVILIKLKKELKLWSLKELLKNFKIRKKNWELPVFVDDKELANQADFFIVNDVIESVKVVAVEDKLSDKNKLVKITLKPL